jgi:YVTN family beta-propeller protein
MRGHLVAGGLVVLAVAILVAPALAPGPGTWAAPLHRAPGSASEAVGGPARPAAAPAASAVAGVRSVANISVGGGPMGIAYDPASGEIFVANNKTDNVTVINDSTDRVVANIRVGANPGDGPEGVAYDPATGDIFVPNFGSSNVSVLNGTSNTLLSTLSAAVWQHPVGVAFDSKTGTMYLTNNTGDAVFPITVHGPLGPPIRAQSPLGAAYDPVRSEIWVTDFGASNVSIINTTLNVVTRSVAVGPAPPTPGVLPEGIAYDTARGEMFAVNYISNNVTVINDTSNVTVANITLPPKNCSDPVTPAYDPRVGEVFVTCSTSGDVAVVNDTNDTAFAFVPVGIGPYSDVWDSGRGEIFVTNFISDNVTVLAVGPSSGSRYPVTFTESGLPSGTNWSVTLAGSTLSSTTSSIGFSAANGSYGFTVGVVSGYVPTPAAGKATVAGAKVVVPIVWTTASAHGLTFREVGIGVTGLTWSVTVIGAAGTATKSNTTYAPPPVAAPQGRVVFSLPNGTYTFAVTAPGGWGVARVSGARLTSFSTVNVTGPATVAVHFGALRTVSFFEPPSVSSSGGVLPPGTTWGIRLLAGGRYDAPPPSPATTTNSSVSFLLPTTGHYGFVVSKPSIYRASPAHGAFTVPGANRTIPVRFFLIAEKVIFVERNLTRGTLWGVNLTGPVNLSVNSTGSSIAFALPNGTYTFAIWNLTSRHPHPATGTVVVVAPHAAVRIRILYT